MRRTTKQIRVLPFRSAAFSAAMAGKEFREFSLQAWNVVEAGRKYIPGWHLDAICDHLQAISEGKLRRLLILVPPRHSKSTLVSVMWPAWEWTQWPENRFLFSSYSHRLAIRDSVKCRRLILSPWYQQNWGSKVELAGDQNAKERYENTRGGVRLSTSVNGAATGEGGDRIVCDDPHNIREIESDIRRESVIDWWDHVMSTRGNSPESAWVIIMQRSHEEDLAGHVMAQGDYEVLRLPAEFEPKYRCMTSVLCKVRDQNGDTVVDARGRAVPPQTFVDPRTQENELIWEKRFDRKDIEGTKRKLGSYASAAQLQQRPAPLEGGLIKKSWWKFYSQLPTKFDELIQSWDMAFKGLDDNDYVVGGVWGRKGADKFLVDQVRGQWSFTQTLQQFRSLTKRYPDARLKLVEDTANGPAVIDTLKHEIGGIVAVRPTGGKIARLSAVSPEIEAGNVYLPDPRLNPWVDGFIEEFTFFPNGAHDDQVDATSQGLLRLSRKKTGGYAPVVSEVRATPFPSMTTQPVPEGQAGKWAPIFSATR